MAKGRGGTSDATVIEVVNFNTLNQVFEFQDNKIQHNDFVKLLNNVILTFLDARANVLITIEDDQTGTAVINDLCAMNPIYKSLIYRNTIGPDYNKNRDLNTMVPYSDCLYGIKVTEGIRNMLLDEVFRLVDKNIQCIKSKALITEIESLEMDKNGRIEGNPHDDTVFALGHCLLVKARGRIANINSIFNYCNDIRMDPQVSKHIKLYLSSSYSEDDVQKIVDSDNTNESFLTTSYGMMDFASGMQEENSYALNASINNQMAMNLLRGGTVLPSIDNNIDENIISNIHKQLKEQMMAIRLANPPKISAQQNIKESYKDDISPYMTKKQKKALKQKKDIHNYDPFIDQQSLVDPALQWLDMIGG